MANKIVMSLDRSTEPPLYLGDDGSLRGNIYRVIGAAGFAYPTAIKRFVNTEKESNDCRIGNQSESSRSKVSWEGTVREMISERREEKESEDNTL